MVNMSRINRYAKTAKVAVETELYTVMENFAHLHVMQEIGAELHLSAVAAKYHLLTNRIVKGRVDPVVAQPVTLAPPVIVAPLVVTTASDKSNDKSVDQSDSKSVSPKTSS